MTTTQDHREPQTVSLSVGGMHCAGCAGNIERGLSGLAGVAGADVNAVTHRATVRSDGTVDPAELDAAMRGVIQGLGYQVLTEQRPATHGGHAGHDHAGHDDAEHDHAEHDHAEHDHAGQGGAVPDEHAAHARADAAQVADYRRRFTVAAALTAPALAVSMIQYIQFPGWWWVALVLATPVIAWTAWPFHRSAVMSARHGATTMDTLVSLGAAASYIWSAVVLIGGALGVDAFAGAHIYLETGAVIVTLILLGKWLETRSTAKAGSAIRELGRIQVDQVTLEDGSTVALSSLRVGQRFLARAGATVATDGVVVEGSAAVDLALVTGESVPVHAGPGAEIVGGAIVVDGALTVEATRVGSDTMLAQVARLVDEAQERKANVQRLADRISAVFVPVVIGLSIATLLAWLLVVGDVNRAFTAAVAVLIISCPCALGLATPLAILVGTGRGARLGVLIRGGQVLEDARRVSTVVLDKTGTVTEGRMVATDVLAPGFDEEAKRYLVEAVASAEKRSEHPVGRAIAGLVPEHRGVKDFRVTPGQGVTATVAGSDEATGKAEECADREPSVVRVGSRRMFDAIPDELEQLAVEAEAAGGTAVFAGRSPVPASGALIPVRSPATAEAVVVVRDAIKPTSAAAVAGLRALGLEVVLLTGDAERVATAVAAEVGIDRVVAEVLPGEKADVIAKLQREGKRVAMVGDGINDAPALAQADLGIAIGTGADVAREASDLTIVSGDLLAAVDAIRLSRRTFATIRGNLIWAFAYNVAAIPLAMFGLLNPMIAAGAMGGSSLFVVGNSMRLRGFRPKR